MSGAQARVGVIVTTHGEAPHLSVALESVHAQTFTDWRLVVVCDGASASGVATARALAARDGRIAVVEQARAGVAATRNRGLAELRGRTEAIALLDHDDRWLPDSLARLAAALANAGPAVIGVHGIGRYIDAGGRLFRPGEMERHLRRRLGVDGRRLRPWPRERPTGFANLAFTNCIPVGSALVRSAAFDRAGPFDLRAVPADDHDMWLRLSRIGGFAFLDEVVMEYRRGDRQSWERPRGGVAYVRRKMLASPENDADQTRIARLGYRINERWTVIQALTDATSLARRREGYAAARKLGRAAMHALAYLRGAPVGRFD
jgi:glycosyltransferase involved in cell wall biosynthesis